MNKPLAALLGSMALTACCIARGTLVSTPRGQRRIEELIERGKRSALLAVPDDGEHTRVVMLRERQVSAGVSEVIDLTVQHELHNFVAAGVLVHNKSIARPPPTCDLPSDAGVVSVQMYSACSLPDGGTGFVECFADQGTCEE